MKPAFLLVPLLCCACAAPRRPELELRSSAPVRLPPSAFAGAVRALEALDANRPKDALVQVRALESGSRMGLETPGGLVRVFLHLTVYAESSERARASFDELRAALEADARAPLELAPVSTERARAAVGAPSWDLLAGEELLSYSDALRIELTPAHAPLAAAPIEPAGPRPESVGIEEYVLGLAAAEGIETLDLSLRASAATPGVSEMRCHIQDAPAAEGHPRAELGSFLAALENGSPAACLTEVRIERSRNSADVLAARAWAFEALLVVRVPSIE